MGMVGRVATAAALLGMVAAPASAQPWRFDFGINGGYSWYSNMLSSDETGVDDQDIAFSPNWLLGSQATFWFSPRIGLRANGTYTDTDLEAEST